MWMISAFVDFIFFRLSVISLRSSTFPEDMVRGLFWERFVLCESEGLGWWCFIGEIECLLGCPCVELKGRIRLTTSTGESVCRVLRKVVLFGIMHLRHSLEE